MTPALAAANNGNWRTAERWARLASGCYRVTVADRFDAGDFDLLLALHARRSHASIQRFAARHPGRPRVVALTGTDLYGDLPNADADAQQSLVLADRLIVLQGDAPRHVPALHRPKVFVLYQSASATPSQAPPAPPLECVVVGHLRAEKDPTTLCRAVALIGSAPVNITHIGRALDAGLAALCEATARVDPRYRWVGERDHAATRAVIAKSHVLIHPSVMEGGAQVVIEAVRSGAAVLASRMSGNVGLLGDRYAGYFDVGDSRGLAALLARVATEKSVLDGLREQCAARAPLFTEAAEQAALLAALRPDKS